MTEGEFVQLLARAESETIDFKQDHYDLPASRNELAKDILAMANTPRDRSAHIVLGVRWTPEAGSQVVGLPRQIDDTVLQDAISAGRLQPRPRFTYTPFQHNGMLVGVIEIPVAHDGPYTPVKDIDGLQAGAVYFRKGTRNDRAVGTELKRIVSWFQGRGGAHDDGMVDAWRPFVDAIHRFDPNTTYLLAADRISSSEAAPIHALGMAPWRAVIDFDPDSDTSGLLSCISGSLGHRRVIHRSIRGDYQVRPNPGTHWFFARGLAGRQDTLAGADHKSWLKAYKQELSRQLERIAASTGPAPTVAVILWSDAQQRSHLRTLIEELHGTYGDTIAIAVVSADSPSFEGLAEEAGVRFFKLSLRSLCGGISVHYADMQDAATARHVLPMASGAPFEVPPDDWLWISEDLELADRSVGLSGSDDPVSFRRGGDVDWRNLNLRHDCERDITQAIRAQVEADLRRRQTVRINLYHATGGGGTTTGRRVAWDVHNAFPTGILRRCAPHDTAERIGKVSTLTENSVLVVVDGGQHSERDIDDLFDYLKASQTPAVLLQVLRRAKPQKTGARQFWLDAVLTDAEADRFRDAYSQAVPARRVPLAELARQRRSQLRNAFFFGLTAFGRDFLSLSPYVERRIAALTELQRRVLAYIAMAHYYGQQSVPAQAFAPLLHLPRSKSVDLDAAFASEASQALDLLVQGIPGEWRTVHPFVALEILQQTLSPPDSKERHAVWRQNLSTWGKEFAAFCRGVEHTASDRLLELARRVFIYRGNVEVLGTERAGQKRFAQLLEDIPSRHGQIELLRHLTECFPLEAHFHAHLGRFLGLNGDFTEGIESIEFAISLQPDDHVLHHMRGMVMRQQLRSDGDAGAQLDQLVTIAQSASESFEEARRLGPDVEHGYISEIQMLVDLVDQVGRNRGNVVKHVLSRPDVHPFLKRALERSEDLLDQVQHLYAGEQPSRYALDCRARMERIYGDYDTSLQAWDSLLARPEVAKPPVRRQIVWTLLARKDSKWDDLTPKETERIQRLLEDNLEEQVNDSTSLRLWLRAVRHVRPAPSLDSVIERVGYWKANSGSLDAAYYLYVLHTLRALGGSSQGAADAERALEECRSLARFRRDRTRSFEWIGPSDGIAGLVHQSRLGEWREDFWENAALLERLAGRVASIDGPQRGLIELEGGVQAFFVPARSRVHFGRDENTPVTCYLGFSYDGPRAWEVLRAGS